MTFPLETAAVTLGSAENNDVVIKRPEVSGIHARFDFDGRHWTVTDADSVAGTLVNEQRVQQIGLANGDRIVVCAATLRFELAAGDGSSPESNGNGAEAPTTEPEKVVEDDIGVATESTAPPEARR